MVLDLREGKRVIESLEDSTVLCHFNYHFQKKKKQMKKKRKEMKTKILIRNHDECFPFQVFPEEAIILLAPLNVKRIISF